MRRTAVAWFWCCCLAIFPTTFAMSLSTRFWTACTACRGVGKIKRPPTRKQVQRHKRLKPNEPLPPRWEPCTSCESSGLVVASSQAPENASLPSMAIIGGGIAGLALAAACRHRGIPHCVYERDQTFDDRSQGYGLTMQQASKALRSFGIDLQGGITSTKHVVHTADGTVVGEWGLRQWGRSSSAKEPKRQNVHIARQSLRRQLWDAAGGSSANIAWNHRLLYYEETEEQKVKLYFQVGDETVEVETDHLVGADGIRSQVRQQLIGEETTPLRYLDCIVMLGICPAASLSHVESELLDGATVFQTADGVTRVYMMPYSADEYMWQLSFPMPEAEAADLSRQGPAALQAQALDRCSSWHTPVPEILRATPIELISGYPVYDRELLTLEQLQTSDNVTLIGDACHPMSPFKGQGANQALLDALALVRMDDRTEFCRDVCDRAQRKVTASAQAASLLHSPVAVQRGNVTRGGAAALQCD